MKHSSNRFMNWIFLGAAGFLGACASTNLYTIQREPAFNSAKISKVMIISLNKDPQMRRAVENEFVRQWRKRSVNAIAGYTVIPPTTPLVKASIAPIAKEQGFDTVVVTRLLGRSKIDPHIRGEEFDVTESTGATQELTP